MHLAIDGFGGSTAKLQDQQLVYNILDELPDRIGMTKIMPPYVFKYSGVKPEDWGISGFVLIAESHISIHTFPEKGYVNVDVFSCKYFESQAAIDYVTERFELEGINVNVLDRGLEYPTDVASAASIVRRERSQVLSTVGASG